MRVKALTSFVGRISMNIDDEREIIDKELAKDLIRAGYVIEIKTDKKADDKKTDDKKADDKKADNKKVDDKKTKNKSKK